MRWLLVADPGGHLALLHWLDGLWQGQAHTWLSIDTLDSRERLAGERVVWGVGPTPRRVDRLVVNTARASALIRAIRPDVLVTTGAALGLAAGLAARRHGVPSVFLEVVDRLERPSTSGRVLTHLVDAVALQLPEQRQAYPDGVVVGRVTPPPLAPAAVRQGVYVSLGTHHAPMERLIRAAEAVAAAGHTVEVQHGHSRPARGCTNHRFLPPEAHRDRMANARVVVLHGGSSTLAEAWALGHAPLVVPRDPAHGEHVDPHQLQHAARLPVETVVWDPTSLPDRVSARAREEPPSPRGADPDVLHRVRVLCEAVSARRGRASGRRP